MIIRNKEEMVDEIIDFWLRELPHLVTMANKSYFYKKSTSLAVLEFVESDLNDFKNYPWDEKVLEKRRELFGF